MTSKLMTRKQAWARKQAARLDADLAVLRPMRVDDRELRRRVGLARGVLQAERAWLFASIRDRRGSGAKRLADDVFSRYTRALAAYLRSRGVEPEYSFGYAIAQERAGHDDIDQLVASLRALPTPTASPDVDASPTSR